MTGAGDRETEASTMFLVCCGCGQWSTDRPVVDGRIVCSCGYRRRFPLLPMFVLTGASGAGKTTIGDELLGRIGEPVVLDADILWSADMDTPGDGYARFRGTSLRVAGNLPPAARALLPGGSGAPCAGDRPPRLGARGPLPGIPPASERPVLAGRV